MKLYRIILVVFIYLGAGLSSVVSQSHFRAIAGIPHLPLIDPSTVIAPQVGMLIFSSTDLKPMLYTGSAWETLCTENVSTVTSQEYFVVKNGIPILPVFGTVPVGSLASGTIYYSTADKSVMIYTGSSWAKMVDLLPGIITDNSGFMAGVGVQSVKLPVLNSPPSPVGLSVGAFYIDSSTKMISYYDGSAWQSVSCRAVVRTLPLTDLTGYTAMSGGEVLTNGGSPVTLTGICWSLNTDPDTLLTTKTRLITTGSGVGVFTCMLTGLLPNKSYHVRAYALNSLGLVYGEDKTVTTPIVRPTIITLEASNITSISTESGGNITADGGAPITHRGIIWSSVSDPLNDPSHIITDDGSGVGYFPSTLDGLLGSAPYYVRAYAVNAAGVSYGNLVQFTTSEPVAPVPNPLISIAGITGSSAVGTALIVNNGGAIVTERGLCFSTDQVNYTYVPSSMVTPTDIGTYVTQLTGLLPGITYYVKGYARNIVGTSYTSETNFITSFQAVISTLAPVVVTATTAQSGGEITNTGYSTVTERGICWSTDKNPTTALTTKKSIPVTGNGTGTFNYVFTGLIPGTKYYVRAYAINSSGTSYGNQDSLVMPVPATVQTIAASSLYINTATCGGNVTDDGGAEVTKRGVCWSTTETPTISNSHTTDASGTGVFTSVLTGLTANVNYNFRAYAQTIAGVSYGEVLSFMIIPNAPLVVTMPVTTISSMSATCGGDVQSDGGVSVTARGVLWNATGDPLTNSATTIKLSGGAGTGTYSIKSDSLFGNTTYYVRAYAINSQDTAYGDLRIFTTLPAILANVLAPGFTVSEIKNTTAVGQFVIKNNGGAPITGRGIRYSTDKVHYSFVASETLNKTDVGTFVAKLTGLMPNTIYYAQAYAINSVGTSYSTETSFKTTSLAELTTVVPTSITPSTANSGGDILSTGDDVILSKGVCWSTDRNPTYNLGTKTSEALDGTDVGVFSSSITGLIPGTKYYVRAYAVNGFGVAYGNLDSLTTGTSSLPILKTVVPNMITGFTAYSGGDVIFEGDAVISGKGVCWSTTPNPTTDLATKISNPVTGLNTGVFSSYITGLTPGVKYYVRAYAVNSFGTSYGNQDSLTTATIAQLTTNVPTGVTNISATGGGSVSSDGGATVSARGVCWSVFPNPTIVDNFAAGGSGTGSYSVDLTGLDGSMKYYIRAYAINSVGTAYGNLDSLKTLAPVLAVVSTTDVINIGGTTALGRGSVGNNGGALVTERGFCWNTTGTPTVDDGHAVLGSGPGSFSVSMTGLTPNTKYYARAYATNSVGTNYGNEITFSTFTIATVTTTPATEITSTTAKSGGNILSDGGALVTSSGICWNTTGDPTVDDANTNSGLGIGEFIHSLSGLMGGTTYYVRAYAINSAGTAYGNVEIFSTGAAIVPSLTTTTGVSGSTGTTARCGGTISSNGGALIATEGIVWNTTSGFLPDTVTVNKTILSGSGNFSSTLSNLIPGVTYYARAYATNTVGTGYAANEISFTTFAPPIITTLVPSLITNVTVSSGGDISSNGGTDVLESGLCWSTGSLPSIADDHLSDGSSLGLFTRTITELLGGIQYYVRAYARNSVGISYGQVEIFTTKPAVLATIQTLQPIATTSVAGISGGNILTHGGSLVTTRGICWSTQAGFNPDTITVNKTAQTGYYKGSFNANLTNLQANTVYYVRAYVINGVGTSYGDEMSFKTPKLPVLTTTYASATGPTKAVGGGDVTDDGGSDIGSRGVVWSTVADFNPDTVVVNKTYNGGGVGTFESKLTGLKANTTYYIRAYATSIAGISYGNLLSFTTDPASLATLSTWEAINVYGTTATTGGSVSDNGGASILSRGVVWSTSPGFRPDTVAVNKLVQGAMGLGNFSAAMSGLSRGTTYYVRAYAINSIGVAYGNEISFKTFDFPTVATLAASPSSTGYTASGGGTLISNGGTPLTNQGVCWSVNPNPTAGLYTNTSHDAWSGSNFYSHLTGLNPVTKYYVRAYASNNQGTSYGNEVTFTTPPALAIITTNYATPSSESTVTTGGNITFDGGAAVTQRGVIWSTSASFNPDTVVVNKTVNGSGIGKFNSLISNMQLSVSYYVRAYAVNSAGISYGNQVTATLFATAPILNTVGLTQIAGASAMSGGEIISDGGAPVTLKGVCWSTTNNPTTSDSHTTNGDGTDPYTAMVSGLAPNTLYYVRAYAINKIGTAYGVERVFQTNSVPTLTTTTPATDIIATTATSGGEITADGRAPILSRGICWSTYNNPSLTTPYTSKIVDKSSATIGVFIAKMKGLTPATTYYVRAYATNAVGAGYGSQVQFTTLPVMLPTLTTIQPFNVDSVKATSGGNITDDGGMPVTVRGICWSTTPNPTTALASKLNNATGGDSIYTNIFTGLSPGIKYYIRAYATNSKGTAYGNLDSLTTQTIRPTISNVVISNVTNTAGDVSASVITDGGAVTVRGFCWSSVGAPTIADDTLCVGTGVGGFTTTIKNLVEGGTYYVRAFATNSAGTVYSPAVSLKTVTIPTLTTTTAISGITTTIVSGEVIASATSGGNVSSDGGSTVLARGICWSTNSEPTALLATKTSNGTGAGAFASTLTGLAGDSIYYVRAYARNSVGTAYGNEISFRVPKLPVVETNDTLASPSATGVVSGGLVSDNGGLPILARGVCWNTTGTPLATGSHTSDGTTVGNFTSTITGLVAGTKYYLRAYARNAVGTSYGDQLNFTTLTIPTVITSSANNSYIDPTTASTGGEVTSDGGSPVLTRGVYWSTANAVPALTAPHTSDGDGLGDFMSTITGLVNGTTYYVTAYATNAVGIAYGAREIVKAPSIPTIITSATASSFTDNSQAVGGGKIVSDGGAPVTARGVCWGTAKTASLTVGNHTSDGTDAGTYVSTLTGLLNGTTYYVRAYATNAMGTAYGTWVTFTTKVIPTVTTMAPKITADEPGIIIAGGTVTNDGGAPILRRGVCWSNTKALPDTTDIHTADGTGTGPFSSSLSGLDLSKKYYVRAYAVNAAGIAYSAAATIPTTPAVTTGSLVLSDINNSLATCGGTVIAEGGLPVIARGICWTAGSQTATITVGAHTVDGTRSGAFTSNLTGLLNATTYYVRAYATNSMGTTYGAWVSVTTKTVPTVLTTPSPTVSTDEPGIGRSGGNVTADGGTAITARGLCWSNTKALPDTTDAHSVNGSGLGIFTSTLPGLDMSKKYYVRAYAINSAGIAYGAAVSPTTPTVTTGLLTLSDINNSLAVSGGTVTDEGGAAVTARGICWTATSQTATNTVGAHTADGTRSGTFSSNLTGLANGTLYYARAYATNIMGTTYGAWVSVTTKTIPTVLTTLSPTVSIDEPGVGSSGGNVTADGGTAITARGLCWSNTKALPDTTDAHSVDGSGMGIFTSTLPGLDMTKKYYVRAYAINSAGIAYGAAVSPTVPTVTTGLLTLSDINNSLAVSGGTVTDEGGAAVTARGICWTATSQTATNTVGAHTADGTRSGTFSSNLTGLANGTLYYARAYATNIMGTTYGAWVSVTTKVVPTVLTTPSPTVSTDEPGVGSSGGNVTADGGTAITARGLCWSNTKALPDITDTHSVDGAGMGIFTSTLPGLDMTKKYYVRAYAINSAGIAYGAAVSPTTPTVTTGLLTLSDINNSLAVSGGNVTDEGGAAVTARGICWTATSQTATNIVGAHTVDGTRSGDFTSNLTGLANGTLYYARAYATNSMGTTYGAWVSVTTKVLPTVTTANPSVSADEPGVGISGGNVTADGGADITARGVCWSITKAVPDITGEHSTDGSGLGRFSSSMIGLDTSKKYYVRAYATNSAGTAYGAVVSPVAPTVTTTALSIIDNNTVASGGTVIDEGGASVTARGICWSATSQTATNTVGAHTVDGARSGNYSSTMTGLVYGTLYYVRAYATNAIGTTYGAWASVNKAVITPTPAAPTVTTLSPSISTDEPGIVTSGGKITNDGGAPIVARGVCYSNTVTVPTLSNAYTVDGTGTGSFSSVLAGLNTSAKYYVRAYATNSAGITAYGAVLTPSAPTVTTVVVTQGATGDNSVALTGGMVTNEGGADVTVRGVCWEVNQNAIAYTTSYPYTRNGTRSGSFSSTMTGLADGTLYYVRAFATNAMGTTYGNWVTVTTKVIPTVVTTAPTISTDEPGVGYSGGEITNDGGAPVTARGVCWSQTIATPTLANDHSVDGAGTGIFSTTLAGLDVSKKYYVRAYATNSAGTAYGAVLTPSAPTVTTVVVTQGATGDNSVALTGGVVTNEGGAAVTVRGVCWEVNQNAIAYTTSYPYTRNGTRSGSFSSTMTGLADGTLYYVRAFATNAMGTTYGNWVTVTTKVIPTVVTTAPTISTDEPGVGYSGGEITNDGGAPVTARGVCWSQTIATPTLANDHSVDGAGTGIFSTTLAGLDVSKKYYVRAYATNSAGTAYGAVLTPSAPTVTTVVVTQGATGDNSVALTGGVVTNEGGAAVTVRGVCWEVNQNAIAYTTSYPYTRNGTRSGSFSSTMTGLADGTLYYVRAFATNAMGTTYGNWVTVTTKVIPTVVTTAPTISTDEPGVGYSGGEITNDGGAPVTARGVCWSQTIATPTLANDHSVDGAGTGIFSTTLAGLDVSKKYYVRAYATNSAGTAYGAVLTPSAPTVTTVVVTQGATGDNSVALTGGVVTNEGGAAVTVRGVCWEVNQNAIAYTTSYPYTRNGTRSGSFSSTMTGLADGTLYYVRAFATNAMGTTYGNWVTVKTKIIPMVVTTLPRISSETPIVGSSGGNVTTDGGDPVIARGVCWSQTIATPTIANAHSVDGAGTGIFSSVMEGIDFSKKYYVRAYANNSAGTAYGAVLTPRLPTVTTGTVTISPDNSTIAISGGTVTDEGGAAVTVRGVCWEVNQNAIAYTTSYPYTRNGTRSGTFTSTMTKLAPGTLYYIRAFATNIMGTSYGAWVSITTP